MDDLNDLKQIWLSADTSGLPAAADMAQAIRRYRRSKLIRKGGLVLASLLLTCFMVLMVFFYKSVMICTRIGEVCFILAGLMLVYTNTHSLRRLFRIKDHANKDFLIYLEQVRVNRIFYHRRTQVVGLVLVSVGQLLYLYELVYAHLLLCLISYSLTITYLLVAWFIVRPRSYRRQAIKLTETVAHMKRLADQF